MVCLGKNNDTKRGNELHKLLSVLLSDTIKPSEKETIIKQEYHIPTTETLKEELNLMCNLSDLVEEKGVKTGVEQEQTRYSKLVQILLSSNLTDDLRKASSNPNYLKELYQKYNL